MATDQHYPYHDNIGLNRSINTIIEFKGRGNKIQIFFSNDMLRFIPVCDCIETSSKLLQSYMTSINLNL
ncbi:hypothetical protein DERP_002887 [Dermatophagoides pteronyssinus]|uniref:Uncharacterized protein n=1 Tax=Dermatophagoides pteronyssinus TaxID=6956 RepID=A0ABQ8JW55_DERPT|nr:hypothetical protein DERP_002887 [Dermatophagoides pteronyssinus]